MALILLIWSKMYFMKLKKVLSIAALLITSSLLFFACSKNESSSEGKARFQVYLTDDPGEYEAVWIDVKDIKINYSNDTANGWQSLPNVNTGVYDLLKLVNDDDTLLADAELNTGRIEQIRLILGTENYVQLKGQDNKIKLETPSAQQSGLKLNIHQDISSGVLYKLLLDFDVAKSIHKTGNGKYMLKPTIRTVMNAVGGSIKGYVKPNTFQTLVLAIQGADTPASTYTDNGNYMIKGLGAGSYDLHFVPTDTTYDKQTKNGVAVTVGNVTTVDTVTLVQ
jgi:hypothetical protein